MWFFFTSRFHSGIGKPVSLRDKRNVRGPQRRRAQTSGCSLIFLLPCVATDHHLPYCYQTHLAHFLNIKSVLRPLPSIGGRTPKPKQRASCQQQRRIANASPLCTKHNRLGSCWKTVVRKKTVLAWNPGLFYTCDQVRLHLQLYIYLKYNCNEMLVWSCRYLCSLVSMNARPKLCSPL